MYEPHLSSAFTAFNAQPLWRFCSSRRSGPANGTWSNMRSGPAGAAAGSTTGGLSPTTPTALVPTSWRAATPTCNPSTSWPEVVLGDNLFHGHDLVPQLVNSNAQAQGATVFAYPVSDPERYGVAEFDADGRVLSAGGKTSEAQEPLRRHRPVLLRRQRRGTGPPGEAFSAWRAGDHRSQSDVCI